MHNAPEQDKNTRISISQSVVVTQVYFQPDTAEEADLLDQILSFNEKNKPIPLKVYHFKDGTPDPERHAEINGHESARWIIVQ